MVKQTIDHVTCNSRVYTINVPKKPVQESSINIYRNSTIAEMKSKLNKLFINKSRVLLPCNLKNMKSLRMMMYMKQKTIYQKIQRTDNG